MLDAQPAANAPARPPAIQPIPASPAITDALSVRSKPAALLAAATALLPELEAGRALDAKTLREAMSAAFGANDTQGAWVWKDAYEAAEAAMVLFIQRYGCLMRREAGAGPGSAAAMLAMLETLAALEPSQTKRSEEQLALQQFSTPLPLAYAALQAAAIRPGDIVLEPSAGTGMLAVMAECALGKPTDGARSGDPLHLNEIAAVRAGLSLHVSPFFVFPEAVRRIVYTTNAIESLNAKIRRAVRTRGHFPSDEAASKLLYLVLDHAAEAWKRPPREWFEAKTQFAVIFGERFVNV